MASRVSYGGYTFLFQILTTSNAYTAEFSAPVQEGERLVYCTQEVSYGDDSGRVAALFEVSFSSSLKSVSWQARAEHSEQIKGIKVFVESLPYGKVVTPPGLRWEISESAGQCFVYPHGAYPVRGRGGETGVVFPVGPIPGMAAQFILIEGEEETVCIRANEHPPRFKRFWAYRAEEGLEVHLMSEENAFELSNEYSSPTWHIDRVSSWEEAVEPYIEWMEEAYGLEPLESRRDVPEWLRRVAFMAILHGVTSDGKMCHNFAEMEARLHELAQVFPPERTLIKVLGHEGRVDYHVPDNLPGEELGGPEGFARFMKSAHALGFKVLVHMNVWGMALDHPLYPQFAQHQIHDLFGRPVFWEVDYDKDENIEPTFAYISPDAPEFRKLMVDCIGRLVNDYAIDAFHLDQSAFPINDLHHDHMRGVGLLFEELQAAYPGVLFTGEGTSEWVAGMYALSSGQGEILWIDGELGHDGSRLDELVNSEMYRRLLGKYMLSYGSSGSIGPEPRRGVWTFPHPRIWWSERKFRAWQDFFERLDVIPTLVLTDKHVKTDSALARLVLDRAEQWLERSS